MTDPAAYDDAKDALEDAKRFQLAGEFDNAEALYRRAIALEPEHGEALYLLGALRREAGDLVGAAAYLERAAQSNPASAAAWLELTRTRHDLAQWEACATAADRTLAIEAHNIEAELMRAVASFARHEYEAATASIERVTAGLPDDAGVHIFHTRCLMARKLFSDAHAPARRAAELAPGSADAQYLLGACLKRNGQNEASENALQRCLKIEPNHYEALNDLADILIARGDTQAALTCLRRSHAIEPYNVDAVSGLCFYTAFDPNADAAALYEINRDWSRRLNAEAGGEIGPVTQAAAPDGRIRIAYLAYDLFDHVTSWFLEPVLSRHDHDKFHITGYYGNENTDAVTERLGGYADSWQSIASDSIRETSERIRRDGIDILVLASFFRGKDRRVLAYRSAPLQVGYHNRVASTGLDTADYIITEHVSDPVGRVENNYTEALVRLTNHNVYLPPAGAPAPTAAPCLANGYVTFGSFNNLAKIGDNVIETWSKILNEIPHARLLLRSSIHFDNATTRDYFQRRFQRHGIDVARLNFQGLKALRKDHLAGMREVDITLDPFPCNGGTTSCEALWMGLPLITMETDSYMGRQGLSYLAKLDLDDLVARDEAEYVDTAVRLSNDKDRLAALRATLRPRVESEIFDYGQHVLELETAYCHMLNRHRSGKPPAAFDVRDNSILDQDK